MSLRDTRGGATRSIRGLLLTRLLSRTAVILALAGLAVFLVVRRSLAAQFDRNLHDRLQGLASLLFQEGEVLAFEFSDELMPEYAPGESPAFFELRFEDGRPIERSESLGEGTLAAPEPMGGSEVLWSFTGPDGRRLRAIADVVEVHHVYPEEGPDRPQAARVVIVVARGVEDLVAAERVVLAACLLTAGGLLLLLGLVTVRAVSRGLEPANRLAMTLKKLDVDRLPEDLEFGPLPAELQPVGETTEELIRRLKKALQRERRTTANIAHELRTPISELVTVSEVALHEEEDPETQREAIGTVRAVAWRMGRVVSSLLKLARLESEAMPTIREQVDLCELVRAVHQGLTLAQGDSTPQVIFELPDRDDAHSEVLVDPDALAIVVTNLLENAMHYGSPGRPVIVALESSPGEVRLDIKNRADGVSQSDLARFREPLWRKDGARSEQDHSGLGLALAQVVAAKSGWALEFNLTDGQVVATLTLTR